MKTLFTIIFTFLFTVLAIIGGYITYEFYFEPTQTQQETQTNNSVEYNTQEETTPPQEVQQQKYNDHIQASSPTRPVAESSLYLTDEETSELNQLKNKMDDQQLDQEENERFEYLTTRDNARKQMEGNTNE